MTVSLGVGALLYTHAAQSPYDDSFRAQAVPARGITYAGLRKTKSWAYCKGAFEVQVNAEVIKASKHPLCSHGPDPAPVDLTAQRRAELADLSKLDSNLNSSSQLQAAAQSAQLAGSPFNYNGMILPYGPISPKCFGTGTDGKRVALLYVFPDNQPNRAATLIPSLKTFAGLMNAGVIHSSYSGSGSTQKQIRFLTDSSCSPIINTVEVPSADVTNLGKLVNDVAAKGYKSEDRHYEMMVDYSGSDYVCGVAQVDYDDSPSQSNRNNGLMYAMEGLPCWGWQSDHELFHTLGVVQASAPDSGGNGPTNGSHCWDGHDEMCYADLPGQDGFQEGSLTESGRHYTNTSCPSWDMVEILDCHHNDYFNTNGSSSYLSSHWNSANSPYLASDGASSGTGVSFTASGHVYIDGRPVAGAKVETCTGQYPVTDSNGYYHFAVGIGGAFCARVIGGTGANWKGPFTNNNVEHQASHTYEAQLVDSQCYHGQEGLYCNSTYNTWDLDGDSWYNFYYYSAPSSGVVSAYSGKGYYTFQQNGQVSAFGDAARYSDGHGHYDAYNLDPSHAIVGMGITRTDGKGYWLVDNVGNVYSFGDAHFEGTLSQKGVHVSNIVGIAGVSNSGYLLLGADGAVYAIGNSRCLPAGGVAGKPCSAHGLLPPFDGTLAMARTSTGAGYWLVNITGDIYAFGDAKFEGSLSQKGVKVNNIVAMVGNSNNGYWLVGRDGGVFAFGSAKAISGGSLPGRGIKVNNIVGAAGYPGGAGYWLTGSDGGIFAFGNSKFYGRPF